MQSWLAIDDPGLRAGWADSLGARGHARAGSPASADMAVVDAAGLAGLASVRPSWVIAVGALEEVDALLAAGADDVACLSGPDQRAARLALAERALAGTGRVPVLAPLRGLLRAVTDACLRVRERRRLMDWVVTSALKQGFAGARIDLWDPARRALVAAAVAGDIASEPPASGFARPRTVDLVRAAGGGEPGLLVAALRSGLRPMGALVLKLAPDAQLDPRERPLVEDLAGDLSLALELIEEEEHRREADAVLRARERRQAALAHLGQRALSAPVDALLQEAVHVAAEAVGVELGRLLLKVEGKPALVSTAAHGFQDAGAEEPLEGRASAAAYAFARGEPVLVAQHADDPRFVPAPALLARGVSSSVHVAIPGEVGALGALELLSLQPRRFGDDEVHFLQTVAATVGGVLARRRADAALRRSEKLFRQLVEGSPEVIAIISGGRFTFVNPAMARTLGYASSEALRGKGIAELLHPSDIPEVEARMETAQRTGAANPPKVVRMARVDGSWAQLEIISMPVDFEGQPATMAIGRDVTERLAMQEKLKVAERLAAVGTLAAGVAHEINNPLAYVVSNQAFLAEELEALQRALAGRPEAERLGELRQALSEAQEGAQRVRLIVRDLKTFSRAGDERVAPVDVRVVLESSANIAANEIRQRARLVRDLGDVPHVAANPGKLGQVFLNLLVNAAQAIPEDGRAHEVSVRSYTDRGNAVVEIRDTGVGIEPEVLPRIFDPFFTTKPVGVGTGLGLSICHGIITRLGGELQVESEPGRGSLFRVVLPAAAVEARPEPAAARKAPARRGRILVVDDEALVCATIRRALQPEHEVEVEASAPRALERLEQGEAFDLVLCDLLMPELTGMELHERLSASRPEQAERMIFLSGGAFTARAQAFLEAPGRAVLEKPFDVERLRAVVRDRIR